MFINPFKKKKKSKPYIDESVGSSVFLKGKPGEGFRMMFQESDLNDFCMKMWLATVIHGRMKYNYLPRKIRNLSAFLNISTINKRVAPAMFKCWVTWAKIENLKQFYGKAGKTKNGEPHPMLKAFKSARSITEPRKCRLIYFFKDWEYRTLTGFHGLVSVDEYQRHDNLTSAPVTVRAHKRMMTVKERFHLGLPDNGPVQLAHAYAKATAFTFSKIFEGPDED